MQVASVSAGFLFFTGWWFALDASISHHKAGPVSCLFLFCTLVQYICTVQRVISCLFLFCSPVQYICTVQRVISYLYLFCTPVHQGLALNMYRNI